jgi:hypothetical protein
MRSFGIIAIAVCLCCALPAAQRGAQMSAIPIFIADGSGARGLRPGDRQLASWALDAWRRAAAPGLSFAEASLHELGHALGLAHTADFRDIMYFFGFGGDIVDYFSRYRSQLHARADIPTVSGLSEADRRRISTLYTPGSPVK